MNNSTSPIATVDLAQSNGNSPPLQTLESVAIDFADRWAELSPDDREQLERQVAQLKRVKVPASETGPRLKVQTLTELLAEPPVPMDGLWGRWLVRGEMTSIAARAGVGKTAFTRNLMLRAASGGAFMGEQFEAPLTFLYFTREGAGSFFRLKIERLAEAMGVDPEILERVYIVEGGGDAGVRLTRSADLDAIHGAIENVKAGPGLDVVVFDPFTRFKDGSENDDRDMAAAVDAILEIQARFDVATFVPHHASQSGRGLDAWRGHTTFEGGMATGFLLTDRVPNEPNPNTRMLEIPKARYSFRLEDNQTRYFDGDSATELYVEREGIGTEARIREALTADTARTYAELAEITGVSRSTVQRYVDRMAAAGAVETAPDGPNGSIQVRKPAPGLEV